MDLEAHLGIVTTQPEVEEEEYITEDVDTVANFLPDTEEKRTAYTRRDGSRTMDTKTNSYASDVETPDTSFGIAHYHHQAIETAT